MKLHMLTVTVFASALVASCGSKPLTEFECQTLANKEIDFAVSKAPPEGRRIFEPFLRRIWMTTISSAWKEKPIIAATTVAWSRRMICPA